MLPKNELEIIIRELISQGDGYSSIIVTMGEMFGEERDHVSSVYHTILGIDIERHNSEQKSLDMYKPEYADKIYKLRTLGKQFTDITAYFRISNFDLNVWRDKIPEVRDAWDKAEEHDYEVVDAMLKLAKGHTEPEEKVFCSMGELVYGTIDRVYPPNIKAIETWLKAKHPGIWKDYQYVETRSLNSPEELSDEELELKLREMGVVQTPSKLEELEEV